MKLLNLKLLFAILIIGVQVSYGQQNGGDKSASKVQVPDTNQVNQLLDQANSYYFTKPDSCLFLSSKAIELSRQLKFSKGEVAGLNMAGEALHFLSDIPQCLEMHFKALEINRSLRDKKGEARTLGFIGFAYVELGEYRQGLSYLNEGRIYENISDPITGTFNLSNTGGAYEGMNMLDSALFFQQQALNKSAEIKFNPLYEFVLGRLGMTYAKLGQHEQALKFYKQALQTVTLPGRIQNLIAESFYALNKIDSGFYYARVAFANSQQAYQKREMLDASNTLGKLFRNQAMTDSVIYYQDISVALNDSLFGPSKIRQLQLLALKEQKRQQEVLQDKEKYKNRAKTVALLVVLGFFLIIAIILLRNNRHKQKNNKVLENTLTNLRSAHSQLIQSEKMASLGELTAGIAHEIQNPLNFVNNFSDVNTELIDELKIELTAGNTQSANGIADDIKENEKKINHHGKRADAIVKNMLQHSRTSTGKKEPTGINALCNEYLRLSYNGLRVKDKSFNATMKTDFDESIGNINIVPQDMGRVVLNLINNAFYAVDEKKKSGIENYEPIVTVSTKTVKPPLGGLGVRVELIVADNGNGIQQKVLDKIFQPFFTTKPTGQGTGLGLSLSYDIVKAHGGELKVETKEGEGSTFIIQL